MSENVERGFMELSYEFSHVIIYLQYENRIKNPRYEEGYWRKLLESENNSFFLRMIARNTYSTHISKKQKDRLHTIVNGFTIYGQYIGKLQDKASFLNNFNKKLQCLIQEKKRFLGVNLRLIIGMELLEINKHEIKTNVGVKD